MIRKSFRIALYCLFYWNAISNAQPTAKIILPPRSPTSVTTDYSCSSETTVSSCTPSSLLHRVSLVLNEATPSMSSAGTLPSNTSTSTSTSSPESEDTLHSSVPVVAGSLAGLIAILAVILTVIVIRRKKRLVESRATNHPPCLGRNRTAAFTSDSQSPVSPSSASGSANPFISPILTRPPTNMSGSRYKYMADDLELTQRAKLSPRNRPEEDIQQLEVATPDSDGEHRHVVPPRQIQLNGHNPSTPYPTLQAEPLFAGDREAHEKTSPPRTISNRGPVSGFPSPTLLEVMGGPAAHSISPLSNGHKSSSTNAVSGALPDKVWNPRGGTDQTGDLPPAYDDVR